MKQKTMYYVFIEGAVRTFNHLPEGLINFPRAEKRFGPYEVPHFYNLPNKWEGKSYQYDKVILKDVNGKISEAFPEVDFNNIFKFCERYLAWYELKLLQQ